MVFQGDDLKKLLYRKWSEKGWTSEERIGVSIQELVDHSAERNKSVTSPYLDLWLCAYDEMLSWLLSLLTVFQSEKEKRERPLSEFDRSILMVLMKILGDGIAIRNLIIDGYDSAARTILRSTGEYMEVAVIMIDDPSFSHEFDQSDTPERAKLFWEKCLRPKKIRSQVRTAWRRFFSKCSDEQAAVAFADWGYKSFELLSAIAHPSFGGAMLTSLPLKSQHSDENWLGVWGDKSDASVETISIFSAFLFPILVIDWDFPFNAYKGDLGRTITYDETNELHQHVQYGRSVLSSMILSMHSQQNRDHIFPEADLSIFASNEPPSS